MSATTTIDLYYIQLGTIYVKSEDDGNERQIDEYLKGVCKKKKTKVHKSLGIQK